jgi:hypothetical protein
VLVSCPWPLTAEVTGRGLAVQLADLLGCVEANDKEVEYIIAYTRYDCLASRGSWREP